MRKNDLKKHDSVVSGLIGQAVGDAFGVPVEFMSRKEVRELNLQDMAGCDCGLTFESRWGDMIPAGAWSDDTSMTVAAMASIVSKGGWIDYDDIMRQFMMWWIRGRYTSLDFPFGLGTNVGCALERFVKGVPALECGGKDFMDNGNGALMRIFPFAMYCIKKGYRDGDALTLIRQAAGITHGHEINAMSCWLYTLFLRECLRTGDPVLSYRTVFRTGSAGYSQLFSEEAVRAHALLLENDMEAEAFDPDRIPESGYVVDSLSVAVYSILKTDNYEDAVKMAVNFGYDTDTNAAITGSIAGAMYGMEQIPARWLSYLKKADELTELGERFSECIVRK